MMRQKNIEEYEDSIVIESGSNNFIERLIRRKGHKNGVSSVALKIFDM